MKYFFIAVLFYTFTLSAFADVITLKSGKNITGKIIKQTDEVVKIESLGVELTYNIDDISYIGKQLESLPVGSQKIEVSSDLTEKGTIIESTSGSLSSGEKDMQKKFEACEPGTRIEPPALDMFGTKISYLYEIIGPTSSGCKIKSSFIENPNPAFVGKQMVCEYDNTKSFNDALVNMESCTGELNDIMNGQK